MSSFDDVPVSKTVSDIRNSDIFVDEIDRALEIIDSGLRGLAPLVGTAREFSDSERELCKFGLEVAQLALNAIKSVGIGHGAVLVSQNGRDNPATGQQDRV